MKIYVIVPVYITVEVPGTDPTVLYDQGGALRRGHLLDLALTHLKAGPDVELPADADDESVIFLDENDEELADHSAGPVASI